MKIFLQIVLLPALLALTSCAPEGILGENFPTFSIAEMTAKKEPPPTTPPLYCKVGRGSAFFENDWYDFGDANFSLYRGRHTNVKISRYRGNGATTIQGFFDGSGQKLIFCPFVEGDPKKRISCASLYALDDDLRDGIKRTFDIPEAIRGGYISCAYNQSSLRPLTAPGGSGN